MPADSDLAAGATPPDFDAPAPALRRLLQVSVALNTIREPDALLAFIIETATDVLRCGAASLLLYDEAEGRLRFAAATGEEAATLAEIPVPLHGSIAGTIYRENRPVYVPDTRRDERHFDGVAEATGVQTHALLGVPLRVEGRPIGVFEVLNPQAGGFTDDDVATLQVLAAQAAVAIENVRQRRALADARDRLAQLDRLKSDFMALASHELRTPIAIILGYADILREESAPEMAEFVGTIQEAGGRLHTIVETLEEVSVLQSADAELDLAPTVLQDVLRLAWAGAHVVAADVDAEAQFDEQPLRVRADRARLRLVFTHVLKNALAFSPPGGRLLLKAYAEGRQACVEIRDEGAGLSEADCARVFEPFYQVQDPLTREHEGMGTGLTVAQALVRAHGGQIWAESAGEGHGATFHVRLPLLDAA